jgi:hypothetical protein
MGLRVKKESLSPVKTGSEDLSPFVKEELARQEKLFQDVTARRSKDAASYRVRRQDFPAHGGVALACRLLKRLVRIAFPSLLLRIKGLQSAFSLYSHVCNSKALLPRYMLISDSLQYLVSSSKLVNVRPLQ